MAPRKRVPAPTSTPAAPAPPAPFQLSDLARQFLELAAAERTAAERRDSVKGYEGAAAYRSACKVAADAQEAARDMAASIVERPTESLSDLIEKALVAREYYPRWSDGTIVDLTLEDVELTAAAQAMLGILSLAGLDNGRIRPPGCTDPAAAEQAETRRARRFGDSPSDCWRILSAENDLLKLEALGQLTMLFCDSLDTSEHQAAVNYISQRMLEHVSNLQTTLYGDARELAKKGGDR